MTSTRKIKKRYNNLKKNLKKRSLKKRNNNSKKNLKKQRATGFQLLNIGSTNTTIKNNDNITNSSVKWSGNYDGKLANIHVAVNDNGRKEDMDIKLTNDDLTQLLGYPSIEKQIDARLFDDFLGDRRPIYLQ